MPLPTLRNVLLIYSSSLKVITWISTFIQTTIMPIIFDSASLNANLEQKEMEKYNDAQNASPYSC